MNQFNVLHGEEQNEPPRKRNSQPTAYHFKYRTSSTKNIPTVSDIMGRVTNHAFDKGNVEVHTSDFPVESNSESVQDPDTTPIRSIDGD